ncbi:basic proline-rich protein-like [Diceros bicornis minor]|uniref:basic proline-rich protein-like n=1 Tax=Diceros bicornis minor TaxID=77932 RepID=UPI0026EE4225|nr:basic proline-rich protein-like [Diceros bicornis minor]
MGTVVQDDPRTTHVPGNFDTASSLQALVSQETCTPPHPTLTLHCLVSPQGLRAEPPEFPFACRSVVPTLRTEAAHQSPGLPLPGRVVASGPSTPRARRLSPVPTARPWTPHSPPGRAPRDERNEAGAGRSGLGICARRPRSPRQPPGGGSGGAAAVTRRPRGGKLRPLPAPPAAALPPPGTKETKPRRPGRLRSFPPRPPGRPPPTRRPGQAGSSRESRARGPEPPGTPHSSLAGSALAEGGPLPCWGQAAPRW